MPYHIPKIPWYLWSRGSIHGLMKENEHLLLSSSKKHIRKEWEGRGGRRPTLSIFSLEYSKKPGSQKAELSLTSIWECRDHFSQGSLSTYTGESVVVGKQKPWGETKQEVTQLSDAETSNICMPPLSFSLHFLFLFKKTVPVSSF